MTAIRIHVWSFREDHRVQLFLPYIMHISQFLCLFFCMHARCLFCRCLYSSIEASTAILVCMCRSVCVCVPTVVCRSPIYSWWGLVLWRTLQTWGPKLDTIICVSVCVCAHYCVRKWTRRHYQTRASQAISMLCTCILLHVKSGMMSAVSPLCA